MNKRLAIIIVIGVIAIVATYFLTKPPEDTPFPEQLKKPAVGGITNGVTPVTPANTSAPVTTDTTTPATPADTGTSPAPSSPSGTPPVDSTTSPQGSLPDANQLNVPLQNQQGLNLTEGIKNAISQALPIPGGSNAAGQATAEDLGDESNVPMPAVIDATDKMAALMQARALAGRRDPFAPITARKPFPRARKTDANDIASSTTASQGKETKSAKSLLDENTDLPAPPTGDSEIAAAAPDTVPESLPAGITSDELPPPPDKPLLVQKLKLNGIVGNRAILAFKDKGYSRENGWRPYVTLGPGDRFDSVKLIAINDESVVLEEEGQQQTLVLGPIR